MVTGSCLCGGIQFTITGPLNPIQLCHCQQCRKAQGAPFASNVPVDVNNLEFTQGQELFGEFESQTREGKYRVFCSRCGSPIMSRLSTKPDVVRVRVGTLDEPFTGKIALHQFVAHKAAWWDIPDDLPQHDGYPSE